MGRPEGGCSFNSEVGLTNLYRPARYAGNFVTQDRIDGPVHERPDVYVERSPLYHADELQTPLPVHVADSDRDVNSEEVG
jgi:hypothetical protein